MFNNHIHDRIKALIISDLKDWLGGSDDWERVWVYRDKYFPCGMYDQLFQDFIHNPENYEQ